MLVVAAHQLDVITLQITLAAERPRLVAFCAHVSGSWDAAEDLAQETLLEAWRVRSRLYSPAGLAPWLTAIARNVCLHWRRSRGRESARLAHGEALESAVEALSAEDDDTLAETVERSELGAALERALVALPLVTRAALIGAYVDETSQAELAARLGLSEGALRVRLHRGRMALREALAPAGAANEQTGWQTTRIWCPFCGQRRLEYRLEKAAGSYAFRCSGPCASEMDVLGSASDSPLVAQFSSPKSLLAHHCLALGDHYRAALDAGRAGCLRCGHEITTQQWLPGQKSPSPTLLYGIHLNCPTCQAMGNGSAWHLSLDTPEAQRFWRRHPQMRALPTREIETGGRPALVIGYESVIGNERLEIVADRATYQTLKVYGEAAK